MTTVIWLVAFPLTAYRFHLVSPVALLMNPIATVPVAISLFSGFGVLIFGWLVPPLGAFFGAMCDGSLALLEWMIGWAQTFEWGHFRRR